MTTNATNHPEDAPTRPPDRPADEPTGESADGSDDGSDDVSDNERDDAPHVPGDRPDGQTDPLIDARAVSKRYGDVTALEGVSLAVERGETVGLLGTNGAGKTTLFKLLVGHLRPDGGTLAVAGRDVREAGVALRHDVGYLPEHSGFPGALSGREVLAYHATMRGLPAAERQDRVESTLAAVGLADAADRPVAGYSNGMGRRLGLAAAVLAEPRILLLDEPTAGLDPLGVATFHRVLDRLREGRDLTVLVSSHALGEVEALCDRVVVLHEGRVHAAGTVAELTDAADEPPAGPGETPDGTGTTDETRATDGTRATNGTGPTGGAPNGRGLAHLFETLDATDDGTGTP